MDITSYWPLQAMTKTFANVIGLFPALTQQTQPEVLPNGEIGVAMRETDWQGQWTDTWHLRHDPTRGVLETQDDYPNTISAMAAGLEIPWGTTDMFIGQTIEAPIGTASTHGFQVVTLAELLPEMDVPGGAFHDVVRLDWIQAWGNNTYAGSYYMAPDVGMIRMDWMLPTVGSAVLTSLSSHT